MTARATVRNIPQNSDHATLFTYPEVSGPLNGEAREVRYCQTCGVPFVRKVAPTEPVVVTEYNFSLAVIGNQTRRYYCSPHEVTRRRDHGERFCNPCKSKQLQPDIIGQESYQQRLPGTVPQMKHATHLPKYDRSLETAGRASKSHDTAT